MKRLPAYITVIIFILLVFPLFGQARNDLSTLNRILNQNNLESDKSIRRLSSGTILWTDDPASKAIYEKLKSHIDFLAVTINNQQDLISYYQVRDGYLGNISATLQRIRDLILMKSNAIYNSDDKQIIDSEIRNHYYGILNAISWAEFNTKPLFNSWINTEEIKGRFEEDQFYSIAGIDRIMEAVRSERSRQGALTNALKLRNKGQGIERENSTGFLSQGDTDFAYELSKLQQSEIMFFSDLFLLKKAID
jgi:flagellin-like hook-associated protein FlgL